MQHVVRSKLAQFILVDGKRQPARRLARLGIRCVTAATRYRHQGYWRRPLRNLLCLSLYFAGMPPERIARIYR